MTADEALKVRWPLTKAQRVRLWAIYLLLWMMERIWPYKVTINIQLPSPRPRVQS